MCYLGEGEPGGMVESQVMIARGQKRPNQDGGIGDTMDQRGTGSGKFLESMDKQQEGVMNAHWLLGSRVRRRKRVTVCTVTTNTH